MMYAVGQLCITAIWISALMIQLHTSPVHYIQCRSHFYNTSKAFVFSLGPLRKRLESRIQPISRFTIYTGINDLPNCLEHSHPAAMYADDEYYADSGKQPKTWKL